jgi:SAM-dependent methyltransferase
MVLAAILKTYPAMRGVLFDLPEVVERARSFIQASGLAGRCDVVGGDFLQDVPAGYDAYVLSSIVHNWGDEMAAEILAACHRAMRPDSRLLLIEHVIPTDGRPTEGKFLDLEMLVLFSGGRERTAAEYRALLARAGFRLARIIPTVQSFNVLEARRA